MVSISALAKALSMTDGVSEAMLLRMEQENLVRRAPDDAGFEILFSGKLVAHFCGELDSQNLTDQM